MLGPRSHNSPESPSFASLTSSTTRRASRLGRSCPTLPTLLKEYSSESRCVVGDVSVKPYPNEPSVSLFVFPRDTILFTLVNVDVCSNGCQFLANGIDQRSTQRSSPREEEFQGCHVEFRHSCKVHIRSREQSVAETSVPTWVMCHSETDWGHDQSEGDLVLLDVSAEFDWIKPCHDDDGKLAGKGELEQLHSACPRPLFPGTEDIEMEHIP